MQLSIIIVNYNVKYFCEQCLCSVQKAVKEVDAEIILVDNNSSDGSMEYLRPKFPSLIFIALKDNVGFARANNKALKIASGEYVLFLNPDTIVAENSFTDCIHFLHANTNAGAVGVQMIDGSGAFLPESKRAVPGILSSFYKLTGLAALFPRSKIFNKYALGNLDKDLVHKSPVLPGAFFMSRKDLLLKVNGFDEDYFMYGEDIDLSCRIEAAGYTNYYLGNTVILHFKGESTKKGSVAYTKQFYNAMIIFAQKHYGSNKAMILKFVLRMVILLKGLMAFILMTFLFLKRRYFVSGANKEISITVAGNSADTKSAETILDSHALPADHISEVEIRGVKKVHGNEIIFCTGHLKYAETLRYIQVFGNAYSYRWHYHNSAGIVGSQNKNDNGEIYTILG